LFNHSALRNPNFALERLFSGIHFGMDEWGNWRLPVTERRDDNSPAIYGWVSHLWLGQASTKWKSPAGTAERFFRP
jgi:hypothetical protein